MCALLEHHGVHGGGLYSFRVLGGGGDFEGRSEKRRNQLHPPEYSKQQLDRYKDIVVMLLLRRCTYYASRGAVAVLGGVGA